LTSDIRPMRILIVRLSAIGDVVVTTPVARALREAFPHAHLAWAVEKKAAGFLEGNPYLDEVLVWDRPKGAAGVADLVRFGMLLRKGRFDWAIDAQGNLRSAMVARLSGARTVVGNSGAREHAERLYHQRVPRSASDLSSRQRCLDLLKPLGVESRDRRMMVHVSEIERESAAATLRQAGLEQGAPYACLVPATTWAQKHWFEESWAELAVLVRERLGLTPVLMGGPADKAMTDRIQVSARKLSPQSWGAGGATVPSLVGKTSLKTAAAILEGARLTVSVDTALMHASVAVGTPTVGVCGASWWKGFQDYERFALVREEMACSPCLHRPTCGGRFDCMRALTAERVLAAAQGLLGISGLVIAVGTGVALPVVS
jgi:heptosyltransferase I